MRSSDRVYNTIMHDFAQRPRDLPRVHLVSTGGTIAMWFDPDQGGAKPAVSGVDLIAAVLAGDLTPQKARVLLMLALDAGERGEALRKHFEGYTP